MPLSGNKPLKCQSCGSSALEYQSEHMVECQHCGSKLLVNRRQAIQYKKSDRKKAFHIVLVSLVLLVFSVTWRVFDLGGQNAERPQSPVELSESSSTEPSQNSVGLLNAPAIQMTETSEKAVSLTKPAVHESVVNKPKHQEKPTITIVHQVNGQTTSGGRYWVVQVRNDSAFVVRRANVVVSLFDASGRRVNEQAGWSKKEQLQPQESTVLLVYMAKPTADDHSIELLAQAKAVKNASSTEVVLTVEDFVINPRRNHHVDLVGEVINPHDHQVDFVKVVAVALNANKQPIGIADAFVTTTNIDAKQRSGFKVSAGTFITEVPHSWSLWAVGRRHH